MFVSAVVLAAGQSTRMGTNKLLLPWRGSTIIAHVCERLNTAGVNEIIVVTGQDHVNVEAAVSSKCVFNERYASGIASSIRTGILASSPDSDGFLVCLGDLPEAPFAEVLARVSDIPAIPTHLTQRGHPVWLPRSMRSELLGLPDQDQGASRLLQAMSVNCFEAGPSCLADIDTMDDYVNGLSDEPQSEGPTKSH